MRHFPKLVAAALVAAPAAAQAQMSLGDSYVSLDFGLAQFDSDYGDYTYRALDGALETSFGNVLLGFDVDAIGDEDSMGGVARALAAYRITPSILAGAFIENAFISYPDFDVSDSAYAAGVYGQYMAGDFGAALALAQSLEDGADDSVFANLYGTMDLPSGIRSDFRIGHVFEEDKSLPPVTSFDILVGYQRDALSADLYYTTELVDDEFLNQSLGLRAGYDFGKFGVFAGVGALADDFDDVIYSAGVNYEVVNGLSLEGVYTHYDDMDGWTEDGIGLRLSYLMGTPSTVYGQVDQRFEDFSAAFASY
ncbi:hypothetical protein ACXN5S_05935 [Pseudoroseicyclus sp. H15]